jgi:hemerythrin
VTGTTRRGSFGLPSAALAQFLADWVAHHIQGEDKAMVTWLKAHKGMGAAAHH